VRWLWEYDPDEQHVIGGAPPAFVAEVDVPSQRIWFGGGPLTGGEQFR
jgi:hypothetical protein